MTLKFMAAAVALALAACGGQNAASEPDPRPLSEVLATDGLAAAERKLVAEPASAETSFQLGAVRFLRAQEAILQIRYANYAGALPIIPGMRMTLPPNSDGRFDPAFLERAMNAALEHLADAETALEPAVAGEFATEVDLRDLWFDVDANGERDEVESLTDLMATLGARPDEGADLTIRFDTADAEWLKAYVHVMSAMAEVTLALDPTPAIRAVWDGRRTLEEFGAPQGIGFFGDDNVPDTLAAVLLTLKGPADRDRSRAAHVHFESMIAHNRAFWDEVARETDNDREWLPNPSQTSAFGVEVTEEMAAGWQDVLAEMERVLSGDVLVPYWRIPNDPNAETGVGINIRKVFEEPGDMDLILWIQGSAAAPYLERGDLVQLNAWERFARMTRGDSLLLAAWFN